MSWAQASRSLAASDGSQLLGTPSSCISDQLLANCSSRDPSWHIHMFVAKLESTGSELRVLGDSLSMVRVCHLLPCPVGLRAKVLQAQGCSLRCPACLEPQLLLAAPQESSKGFGNHTKAPVPPHTQECGVSSQTPGTEAGHVHSCTADDVSVWHRSCIKMTLRTKRSWCSPRKSWEVELGRSNVPENWTSLSGIHSILDSTKHFQSHPN